MKLWKIAGPMSIEGLLGNVESVLLGEGFSVLTGWVCIRANHAVPAEASLTIWDGTVVALSNFHFRQDLRDAGFGPCAFQACVATNSRPGDGSIVEIAAAKGTLRALRGISPQMVRPFEAVGSLEHVSLSGAWGWVYDPGLWLNSSPLVLRFDGCLDIPLPINIARPDIPFEESTKRPLGFGVPLSQIIPLIMERFPNLWPLDGGSHRYELLASGRIISTLQVDLETDFAGKVEGVSRGALIGWASARHSPNTPLEIEILADGQAVASVKADLRRPDLAKLNISESVGGFRVPLTQILREQGEATLTARPLGSSRLLKGSAEAKMLSRQSRSDWLATLPFSLPSPTVTVIIPIFNAAADLSACLESIVRWTGGAARLLLIDDASTESSVGAVLDQYGDLPRIRIHRNRRNLGFTKTCNHAIGLLDGGDIVLLNSDTIVGPRWLENLQFAAYSRPTHGTATPLSNNAGIFSFPTAGADNRIPGGSALAAARLVAQNSGAWFPEVPTGHGFCLYIRRDCLDQTGLFDAAAFPRGYGEENDFCLRARRSGWTHVLDDRTYIVHRGSASFQAERSPRLIEARKTLDERYPEYSPLVEGMTHDPSIHAVRGRVSSIMVNARRPRPRLLFVVSTETGGTPQTNRDLMSALTDRYEAWLLRCDTQSIFLYEEKSSWSEPVNIFELDQPIQLANHRSTTYNGIVAGILLTYAIELVHIRHLAWHSLDLPAVARRLGIPVVLSFHDFYAICPTVKLLDEKKQFCAGRCTAGDGVCLAELWPLETVPHLKHRFVYVWRAAMLKAIEACNAYVTTSASAAAVIKDNFPLVGERGLHVIAHGRSFPAMRQLAPKSLKEAKFRVMLPGNLSEAKGSQLVRALAQLSGSDFEFHILGDSGHIQAARNIVLHGRYERDEIQDRIASIRPQLGLILSIWPETWSHTLTELWACGLPVLALDTGAVSHRIGQYGGGWLLPPRSGPDEILDKLQEIRTQGPEYLAKLKQVRAWQDGFGRLYDTAAMAAHYDSLYRSVMRGRLAFARDRDVPVVLTIGVFETPPDAEALAERSANDLERKIVLLPLSDVGGIGRLAEIPARAILAGGLPARDLAALRKIALRHEIPLIQDAELMAGRPAGISDYDELVLLHLAG